MGVISWLAVECWPVMTKEGFASVLCIFGIYFPHIQCNPITTPFNVEAQRGTITSLSFGLTLILAHDIAVDVREKLQFVMNVFVIGN